VLDNSIAKIDTSLANGVNDKPKPFSLSINCSFQSRQGSRIIPQMHCDSEDEDSDEDENIEENEKDNEDGQIMTPRELTSDRRNRIKIDVNQIDKQSIQTIEDSAMGKKTIDGEESLSMK